jgi:Fe2+ or Zn2+ uptake regulation protein
MERRTRQKRAIEAAFEDTRMATAQEIRRLAVREACLGIATVYRPLKALQRGRVACVEIEANACYELADKGHHHIFCRVCGGFELKSALRG